MASETAQSIFTGTSVNFAKYLCIFQYKQNKEPAVILVWKLWTVYAPVFVATAILSCVIKIRGLFKSTKWRHLKMSNLKLSRPGVMLYNIMPENLYPQLPTAPPISQESFNIEMVRKYYQDIANLNPKQAGLFRI